jgi:hypothetical protein
MRRSPIDQPLMLKPKISAIRMRSMRTPVALTIDTRLQEMAAVIHGVIPGSEGCLLDGAV